MFEVQGVTILNRRPKGSEPNQSSSQRRPLRFVDVWLIFRLLYLFPFLGEPAFPPLFGGLWP